MAKKKAESDKKNSTWKTQPPKEKSFFQRKTQVFFTEKSRFKNLFMNWFENKKKQKKNTV